MVMCIGGGSEWGKWPCSDPAMWVLRRKPIRVQWGFPEDFFCPAQPSSATFLRSAGGEGTSREGGEATPDKASQWLKGS